MSDFLENAQLRTRAIALCFWKFIPQKRMKRDRTSAPFSELIKSPEHIHTYRIAPLSIWNARAAGMTIRGYDCHAASTR
jgi:DNA excision repair protein ERCC-3